MQGFDSQQAWFGAVLVHRPGKELLAMPPFWGRGICSLAKPLLSATGADVCRSCAPGGGKTSAGSRSAHAVCRALLPLDLSFGTVLSFRVLRSFVSPLSRQIPGPDTAACTRFPAHFDDEVGTTILRSGRSPGRRRWPEQSVPQSGQALWRAAPPVAGGPAVPHGSAAASLQAKLASMPCMYRSWSATASLRAPCRICLTAAALSGLCAIACR